MAYPRKIGDQKELRGFESSTPHEFLVIVGGSDPAENRMQVPGTITWFCTAKILGFINLTTGRKFDKGTKLYWKETQECLSTEDNFKSGTIYRIKGYLSGPWNLDLVVAEILSEGESDAFLEGLYEEWLELPKPFESDMFGLMEYEDYSYRGTFNWLGKKTVVDIRYYEDDDGLSERLKCAEDICRNCAEWDRKFRESIADVYFEEANDMSLEEFNSHIEIVRIEIEDLDDGAETFEIIYGEDGSIVSEDILIILEGNTAEGVTDAHWEG